MTNITAEHVRVLAPDDLPLRWAQALGQEIVAGIGDKECAMLEERIVSLGHGVDLAHLRTHLVEEPTLGAYKSHPTPDGNGAWLRLLVFIPRHNASRHLGWMAHLAAGLHDVEARQRLREAETDSALLQALDQMLEQHTHHFNRGEAATPPAPAPADDGAALERRSSTTSAPAATSHHLVIAILKEVEYVDHLLELFVEHDVRGATILEARGMAEHLAAHMSLFAGFKSAFKAVGHSQVILTVVPHERVAEVIDMIRNATGGMNTPGAGVAFSVPLGQVAGLNKEA